MPRLVCDIESPRQHAPVIHKMWPMWAHVTPPSVMLGLNVLSKALLGEAAMTSE